MAEWILCVFVALGFLAVLEQMHRVGNQLNQHLNEIAGLLRELKDRPGR